MYVKYNKTSYTSVTYSLNNNEKYLYFICYEHLSNKKSEESWLLNSSSLV